jgi:5'-methylthioadenosine phosphorylase
MEKHAKFAVIGGSGLYRMSGLTDVVELNLETPFGQPSSPVVVGTLAGQRLAFLARHGLGHFISPSEVNYRANIFALKSIGVERMISISACGSLRDDYAPGDIVIPDQLFDLTRDRKRSFFGDGLVAHISVAEPFCAQLSEMLYDAAETTGARMHRGGTVITVEGPRFSTRAESNVYRTWGMSLIGMTTSPEAFLAREAEICYAVMAHVTDYDVWHISEQPVTVDIVVEILNRNTQIAFQCVENLAAAIDRDRTCECGSALANALITRPDAVPLETRQRLGLLVDRYLGIP